MSDYCPPPTDRVCTCRQCRAEWAERERELERAPPHSSRREWWQAIDMWPEVLRGLTLVYDGPDYLMLYWRRT